MNNTKAKSTELWVADNRGQIGTLDISTKKMKVIGNTGTIMHDIAWSPDGQLWGIDGQKLYKIDSTTAETSLVGELQNRANAIAFDSDGTLYAAGQDLLRINSDTGIATVLGSLPVVSGGHLAFVDGQLYLSTANSEIYKVNIANPASSKRVGVFGIGKVYGTAMTANDATYVASAGDGLVKVNLKTGRATPLLTYGRPLENIGETLSDDLFVLEPEVKVGSEAEQEAEPSQELQEPQLGTEPQLEAEPDGNLLKLGPQGSDIDATKFEIRPSDKTGRSRIKRILINHGWAVHKIKVEYEDLATAEPETYLSQAFGGKGGDREEFILEPGDYITEVIGSWGRQAPGYPKEEIISLQLKTHQGKASRVFGGGNTRKKIGLYHIGYDKLTARKPKPIARYRLTNKKTSSALGEDLGKAQIFLPDSFGSDGTACSKPYTIESEVKPFSFKAPEGYEIIGFFGAYGSHQNALTRIGVYLQPLANRTPSVDPSEAAEPQIIISHIFYDGSVKYFESDEFIEILNKGAIDADISGFKINAGHRRQDFIFPEGTILAAGASYRVYTNEVHPETGGFSFKIRRAIWNNKGDIGYLYDAQGKLLSSFAYGNKENRA
ncbi:MAG: hypothetical protein F6J93_39620 [Oscillatoria sp. SIO1A7]|nr:hypothetical protein [Oscillatoria sp. SIO1A7]